MRNPERVNECAQKYTWEEEVRVKGYYICFGEVGVNLTKKIEMQVEELRKFSDIAKIFIRKLPISKGRKLIYKLPFSYVSLWNYEDALDKLEIPDYVYIRRGIADGAYIGFLKKLRSRYPKCIILVEIFTYPYDKDEFSHWKMWWPYYVRECINRKKYHKYIDRFVTYSEDDIIFGVPTLRSFNGIHVGDYPLRTVRKQDDEIHLLAVAMFRKHHGYERILKGLAGYMKSKPTRKVIMHMVGDGPEKGYYEMLCRELNLQEFVIFEGLLNGEELNAVYDQTDIALGSFAMYKNDLFLSSALKIREYLARGIPVISGCREDSLSGRELPFFKEYPNDDSIVEIRELVEFYESSIENNPDCSPKTIRQYAIQAVSMEHAMRPIVDFINTGRPTVV